MRKIMMMLIAILFIAFGVLSYPFIRNAIATQEQQREAKRFEQQVAHLSSNKRQAMVKEAKAHNKALASAKINAKDPFTLTQKTRAKLLAKYDISETVLNKQLGPLVATLRIPKLDLVTPVFNGVSEVQLSHGVGLLPNTSLPVSGKGVHAVMTGHRGLLQSALFTHLNRLKKGDHFYVEGIDRPLAYRIDQIKVVKPDDTRDLMVDKDQNYTTLITCTPFLQNTHRLLVRGVLTTYPKKTQAKVKQNNPTTKPLLKVVGIVVIGISLISAGLIFIKKVPKT
ncbi:class C sortase [Leuconostoc pseudomesenteroides]|nr:class C sortase [Leuconostoc pseudomesenteroides]